MTKLHDLESHRAFQELLGGLGEGAERYLGPASKFESEQDLVEGMRAVLHLLSCAIDFYLEGDAERPEFVRIVSPTRKILGDNPDAIYHFARIRGDRAYRIRGRKTDECYISFTVHGRTADGQLGGAAEPVLADVNDRGLTLDAEGRFEVVLAPDPRPGDWIQLAPTAASLIVRSYYELPESPAADPDRRVELSIEPLDDPGVRPTWSDAGLAERLHDVLAFVRGGALDRIQLENPPPFVSTTPNELGTPMVFRGQSDSWGAVDIAYSMGPFLLEPDEALLIEGRFPKCAFANVVLWNPHLQAFEYRDRRVSLNRVQTEQGPDGSFRIVIAHRDPGVPNWLDTEGHREGTVFWRFLLPETTPEQPRTRVVKLAELA